MNKKNIVIVHMCNVLEYPPVLSLVENLLDNGHSVTLVTMNIKQMPKRIISQKKFHGINMPVIESNNLIKRLQRRFINNKKIRDIVIRLMRNADILWTTTDLTVRCLGKIIFRYRHIMQLMELEEWYPLYQGAKRLKFPIEKYANKAWKVVVPEENRAYIQKVWWNLDRTPYILPNKPYRIAPEESTKEIDLILDRLKQERKKIIIYLGYIGTDRNLENFIKAVEKLSDEYCLYIVGNIAQQNKENFLAFCSQYDCVHYLGYFPAPKHLLFLKYAYIGLLPYIPNTKHEYLPSLNALYCAPNKIFEYSGYSVPMIGTDVLGLKQPFERFGIGVCCSCQSVEEIVKAIKKVNENYDEMRQNCSKFYNSVDLQKIVENILYDE